MLADTCACTLIVRRADSSVPMIAAQDWVQRIPGARLLEIPGRARFPHVEQPGTFFPALERFLEEEARRESGRG